MSNSKKFIDFRLVLGIVLVASSIAGVMFFLNQANASTPVFSATRTLVPGQVIQEGDVTVVGVRTPAALSTYLSGTALDSGLVVTRTIGAGELIPVSAISTQAPRDMTNIVITLAQQLPKGATVGTEVDLWAAMNNGSDVFGPPTVIASAVTIAVIDDSTDVLQLNDGVHVELVVPTNVVASVLDAQANGDALSLVPTAIARESGSPQSATLPRSEPTATPGATP